MLFFRQVNQSNITSAGYVTCSRQHIKGSNVTLCIDSVIVEGPLLIPLIYCDKLGKEQDRIF